MTYHLTINQTAGYLHAVVTGQNSRENVASYLDEILRESITRNCFRVLIEERLEGPRLGTLDVFNIAMEGSRKARHTMKAIAYVDAITRSDLMKFAEDVAVNRWLPVAVFSTVADAEKWLLNEDNGVTEPVAADAEKPHR